MSHGGAYQGVAAKLSKFIMGQMAYLIEKLKATREGDGNLLDRMLVYYTNEFLDASRHSKDNHPIMFIGKAGGAVKTGIHLKATGENMTKAMVAAVNAVDAPVQCLGSPNQRLGLASGVTCPSYRSRLY